MRSFVFVLAAIFFQTALCLANESSGVLTPPNDLRVVFVEPIGEFNPWGDVLPKVKPIEDQLRLAKLNSWLRNEGPSLGLNLLKAERLITNSNAGVFYLVITPGGNYAGIGFTLVEKETETPYPNAAFIILDESEETFRSIFHHETGHVIFVELNGFTRMPRNSFSGVVHSNAVITDRTTAFDEGFAISLETLLVHYSKDENLLRFALHRPADIAIDRIGEYGFLLSDTINPAQTFDRYHGVRDNDFSFETMPNRNGYFASLFERARDYSRTRSPDELLSTEGFYASFFFRLVEMNLKNYTSNDLMSAYSQVFKEIKQTLSENQEPTTPWLIEFVRKYAAAYPSVREQVFTLLFDLSHGAFFTKDYKTRWTDVYLTALNKDFEKYSSLLKEIKKIKRDSVTDVMNTERKLYDGIGVVLGVEVANTTVDSMRGKPVALQFDLNTVPLVILERVPGISPQEIDSFRNARDAAPWQSFEDFEIRSGLQKNTIDQLVHLEKRRMNEI